MPTTPKTEAVKLQQHRRRELQRVEREDAHKESMRRRQKESGKALLASSGCLSCNEFQLLYAGISPSAPPKNGKSPSTQSLHYRIRYHYTGNAEGSTLRLTLGCLLADRLGITLCRVGSGKRLTFASGEAQLSQWMENHAQVAWYVTENPWKLEQELIANLDLPLNLDKNAHNGYYSTLRQIRQGAKAIARQLPILPNSAP